MRILLTTLLLLAVCTLSRAQTGRGTSEKSSRRHHVRSKSFFDHHGHQMTHFDRQKRDRLRNDNGTAWRRDRVKSSPYKVDADGFDIPLQPRPKNK